MGDTFDTSLDLDCGIAAGRIAAWLNDELALPRSGHGWTFSLQQAPGTCCIQLEPLTSRTLGAINLERTRLVVHGDAAAIAAFNKLFTLRFMSAGG